MSERAHSCITGRAEGISIKSIFFLTKKRHSLSLSKKINIRFHFGKKGFICLHFVDYFVSQKLLQKYLFLQSARKSPM